MTTPLPKAVRHLKRGTTYEVLGEAEAQVSTGRRSDFPANLRVIGDGDKLVVYRGEDGKLWVRFTEEFMDGRFEFIDPPENSQEKLLEKLSMENTLLRASLAVSKDPCYYCQLPADEMAKCKAGFPGCARADDMAGCPEFGAQMELYYTQSRIKELEASLKWFVDNGKGLEADVRSAHQNRSGASECMTEEDGEFRGELRRAVETATKVLAQEPKEEDADGSRT